MFGHQVTETGGAQLCDLDVGPVQEQPDRPLVDLREVLAGQTEDVVDHRDRVGDAELPHQLGTAAGDELLAQAIIDERLSDLGLPSLGRALAECRLDQPPVGGVFRRIHHDDVPAHRLHTADAIDGAREARRVAEHQSHLSMPQDGERLPTPHGEHRALEADSLSEHVADEHAPLTLQLRVDAVGVSNLSSDLGLERRKQVEAVEWVGGRGGHLIGLGGGSTFLTL